MDSDVLKLPFLRLMYAGFMDNQQFSLWMRSGMLRLMLLFSSCLNMSKLIAQRSTSRDYNNKLKRKLSWLLRHALLCLFYDDRFWLRRNPSKIRLVWWRSRRSVIIARNHSQATCSTRNTWSTSTLTLLPRFLRLSLYFFHTGFCWFQLGGLYQIIQGLLHPEPNEDPPLYYLEAESRLQLCLFQ